MATKQPETVNDVRQAPVQPECSLHFAKPMRGEDLHNLWGKPTSASWFLWETEGQARALSVLGLEVEGETRSDKAAELGRIFARIARDQFSCRRDFLQVQAIAAFWGLIGELAAAYTTPDQLGFAAMAVCRRATRRLATHTERNADKKPRRRKSNRAVKRGKAVLS